MSRKGGYKIIDLKGLDFSSNMVIDGIYESIKDNYDKPLLFSGIVIDGVEKDDVFANAVANGDGYDIWLYNLPYHINNNDVIEMKKDENYETPMQDLYISDGLNTLIMGTGRITNINVYYKGVIIPFITGQSVEIEDIDITYNDSFIKLLFNGQSEQNVKIFAKNGVAYIYTE